MPLLLPLGRERGRVSQPLTPGSVAVNDTPYIDPARTDSEAHPGADLLMPGSKPDSRLSPLFFALCLVLGRTSFLHPPHLGAPGFRGQLAGGDRSRSRLGLSLQCQSPLSWTESISTPRPSASWASRSNRRLQPFGLRIDRTPSSA